MSLSNWARLLAWFAAETTALVALAAILHAWFRSPRAGRTLWRAALTAVALVWMVEFSGLREKIPGPWPESHRYVITATVWPASAQPANANDRVLETEAAPAPKPVPALAKWPAWIWLAGFMLLLMRSLVARIWLAVRRRTAIPADQDSLRLMARLQTSLGLRRVQFQVWPGLRSPVAFGIFRPTVALPPDFAARFSSAEWEAMLAHEMAHLAARDPFWLMASDGVAALAWWHPLVWWARWKLQAANEAAADEASALIPGGAHALAECLVRLGRELTASGPARALGVGGNGSRSQLAARIERLLRGPLAWQPASAWARWAPQVSAVCVALASAILPIQTGLAGSILAVLAAAPAQADATPSQPPATVTNQVSVTVQEAVHDSRKNADALMGASIAPITYHYTIPWVTSSGAVTQLSVATTNPSPFIHFTAPEPQRVETARLAPHVHNATDVAGYFEPKRVEAASPAPSGDSGANSPSSGTKSDSITVWLHEDRGTSPPPKVSLLIQSVALTEHGSDDIGLDWVFGLTPTSNPAVETIHDWKVLMGSSPIHGTNIVLDRLRADGQTAILKPEQFAALRDRIIGQVGSVFTAPSSVLTEREMENLPTNVYFFTAPPCLTGPGEQAHIAIQKKQIIVTGVEVRIGSPKNSSFCGYFTDNVPLGFAVDVLPTVGDNGQWHLVVLARNMEFLGYDDKGNHAGSYSAPGGKPLTYEIPHPHFRAMEAVAKDSLLLGETLALRGPLWTETIKTKGHFLVPAKTKSVRKRLYVFVTLTSPPPPNPGK